MFEFDPAFPNATREQKWQQIRSWRNRQLVLSDWTQLPDAPADSSEWASYRQQLRDIDDTQSPDDYQPPTPPTV